jgi:hypothetical protein
MAISRESAMIHHYQCVRSDPRRPLLTAVGLIVLALVLAPNAIACHKGVPHGKDTNCAPGDTLPGESWNVANFNDSAITVPEQRFRRTDISTAGAGDYVAEPPLNVVEIATDLLAKQASSKKYADLCHAMDTVNPSDPRARGPFIGVPSEFSYGWTGECASGSCTAHISMTFSEGVLEMFDGKSDVMNLQMGAEIPGPAGDDDPFLEPQAIGAPTWGVLEIHAAFNRAGTSRVLFECLFRQQGYGSPILYTGPVSPP